MMNIQRLTITLTLFNLILLAFGLVSCVRQLLKGSPRYLGLVH